MAMAQKVYLTGESYPLFDNQEDPSEEDWSFAHLTREETLWGPHGYHRYPAKFIPQLVRRLIEAYSAPGELVGDPFVGSGTTGIEALRAGRRFWGADINAVALLISRAKCRPLVPSNLLTAWTALEAQLDGVPRIGRRHLTDSEIEAIKAIDSAHASAEERLTYWFPLPYRESLAAILQRILLYSEGDARAFFLCGFSNILRRCSTWLSGSTKAQKDVHKVLGDPADEFRRQVRDMLKRNRLYWQDIEQRGLDPVAIGDRCRIAHEDVRQLSLPDASLDLLVTSPPYATCYEYKEIHQLTQLWFERYGIVPAGEEAWIGSKGVSHRASSKQFTLLQTGSTSVDAALAELSLLASGSLTQTVHREVRALQHYFQDMSLAMGEMARVTIPGKYLVLVVGDSYRRGITIPTAQGLCEMAAQVGLDLERRIVRKVPARVLVSTRDKKSGRFSSTAQSDVRAYPEEYVLVFKKR
ncbi:MAG TPA: DNA methyltransferase [Ktedonobacteraceae bacterium]|nr:DNA methyltransferase [Ktedonobacteraceae bacterium]